MIIKKYEVDANIKVLFDYWYLEEISCIPIYRNQEWFNEAKVKLEEFWLKVLKYRELGLDKLKEELKDEKLNKKRDKEIIRDEKNKVNSYKTEPEYLLVIKGTHKYKNSFGHAMYTISGNGTGVIKLNIDMILEM